MKSLRDKTVKNFSHTLTRRKHRKNSHPSSRCAWSFVLLLWSVFAFAHQPVIPGPPTEPEPGDPPCESPECSTDCQTQGKPISVSSGAEMHSAVDMTVNGLYPIVMKRKYDSQSHYDSPLGYGWGFTLDKRLFKYSDGQVVIRNDCGTRVKYTSIDGGFDNPIGQRNELVENADGTFTVISPSGALEHYSTDGTLAYLENPQGHRLEFTYDPGGRFPLTGSSPYNLDPNTPSVVSEAYRLVSIQERMADGTLTGQSVSLHYHESNGRLDKIVANDGREVSYTHDLTTSNKYGNLLQVNGLGGMVYTYKYEGFYDPHNLTYVQKGTGTTPYINQYDSLDRVYRQTFGNDEYIFNYYSASTHVTRNIRSADGTSILNTLITQYSFDESRFGSEVRKVLSDNTIYRSAYTRNSNARITGEEFYVTTAGSATETLVRSITNDYDTSDNKILKQVTLDSGEVVTTTWTYDHGWVESEETSSSLYPEKFRTEYTFNKRANGSPENVYQKIEFVDDATPLTTTYTYDTNNRLWKTELPDGHKLVNQYSQDRLYKTYHEIGGAQSSYLKQQYAYDSQHRISRFTDANNRVTYVYYDDLGRIVSTKNADGEETIYTYDPAYLGGTVLRRVEYGRKTSVPGDITEFSYSPEGFLEQVHKIKSDGTSVLVSDFVNDSAGNVVTRTMYRDGIALETNYEYDSLNRLTKTIDPLGNETRYEYDSFDNIVKITDGLGRVTEITYDALDRQTKTVEDEGGIEAATIITYDAVGNVISVKDPENSTTVYTYDGLSRQTSVTQPSGPTSKVSTYYDDQSRIDYVVNARGNKIDYTFEPWGGLSQIQYFDTESSVTPNKTVTYTHDNNGNILSVTDDTIQQDPIYQFSYDALNRVYNQQALYAPERVQVIQDFDSRGNRSLSRVFGIKDTTTRWSFNELSQLVQMSHEQSAAIYDVDYYEDLGRIRSIAFPNGMTESFEYYDNGPLSQIQMVGTQAGSLEQWDYNLDANLNIDDIQSQHLSGNFVYGYDTLNRLTGSTPPTGSQIGTEDYSYDHVGNREDPADATAYEYDVDHRITDAPNGYSYTYDLDGNIQIRVNTGQGTTETFTHDADNRLIGYTDGSTLASYEYDPFGRRISKNVDGVITYYIWQGNLLQAEVDAHGDILKNYHFLPDDRPMAFNQWISSSQVTYDTQEADGTADVTFEEDVIPVVASDGSAHVIVVEGSNTANPTIKLSRREADGSLTSLPDFSVGAEIVYAVRASSNTSGDVVVVYSENDDLKDRIYLRYFDASAGQSGEWLNAQQLHVPSAGVNDTVNFDWLDPVLDEQGYVSVLFRDYIQERVQSNWGYWWVTDRTSNIHLVQYSVSNGLYLNQTLISGYSYNVAAIGLYSLGNGKVMVLSKDNSNYRYFEQLNANTNLIEQTGMQQQYVEYAADTDGNGNGLFLGYYQSVSSYLVMGYSISGGTFTSLSALPSVMDDTSSYRGAKLAYNSGNAALLTYTYDSAIRVRQYYVQYYNGTNWSSVPVELSHDHLGRSIGTYPEFEIALSDTGEINVLERIQVTGAVYDSNIGGYIANYDVYLHRYNTQTQTWEAPTIIAYNEENRRALLLEDGNEVDVLLYEDNGQGLDIADASTAGAPIEVDSWESFQIHTDHLGTPRFVTDENQAVVWEGRYSAFGELDYEGANGIEQNIRYPGQYHDRESGLYYNYYRDYDPTIGRYIQSDPIGLSGGTNTYAYVYGNPLSYIDPEGLIGKNKSAKFRLVDCPRKEMGECVAECGTRGVKSCKVTRGSRAVVKDGYSTKETYTVPGSKSCVCNDPEDPEPRFCPDAPTFILPLNPANKFKPKGSGGAPFQLVPMM